MICAARGTGFHLQLCEAGDCDDCAKRSGALLHKSTDPGNDRLM